MPPKPLADPLAAYLARLRQGTREHYQDAALYDHEYRRRRADVNYYRRLAAPVIAAGGEVLELGCGSGRLLVPLLRDGARVVGVDLSPAMLRRCQERIARLRPGLRERATLLRADFRELPLPRRARRRVPLVLCPFNAMMHLYTARDLGRFFDGVRGCLAPGGEFAFDIMNPDLAWLSRDPTRRWAKTRFVDPSSRRRFLYSESHLYDAATQINWIRIFYDPLDERPGARVVQLAHRQLFPEELLALLARHGFKVTGRDGGFAGEPFASDSESQVLRCR